jgi:hypothetical protein
MEYFIGSFVTLAIVFFLSKFLKEETSKPKIRIKYGQSYIHNMIKEYLPYDWNKKPLVSQSTKDRKKRMIRIIMLDNNAYWINDNTFYIADIVDGKIDNETKRIVDIYSMDDVQLKKIQFIVDKLTEGITDEGGYSGNR